MTRQEKHKIKKIIKWPQMKKRVPNQSKLYMFSSFSLHVRSLPDTAKRICINEK